MQKLPKTENSLLLRTDFTDDDAWTSLCITAQLPSEEGFQARLDCLSDPGYGGLTIEQLLSLASPDSSGHFFIFIADHKALTDPEHPILVVDLDEEPGRAFRVIPQEMWGIENNLSLSNMDYEEFYEQADPDGVFRGL